ncbi:hypothetical protein NDU88_001120 [Pleurodeles waltl]|uniref:Uncharacterized protein n=1 Tax=Pleurodeles waltl TaxID=8319 RepID=A0AAV7UUF6_PLEWA|nr:hypothetical protein NDU88_001120 [Pleurodeles waltl]
MKGRRQGAGQHFHHFTSEPPVDSPLISFECPMQPPGTFDWRNIPSRDPSTASTRLRWIAHLSTLGTTRRALTNTRLVPLTSPAHCRSLTSTWLCLSSTR